MSEEARRRARALLLDYLSPEQRRDYEATGHFDVVKTGSRRSLRMLLMAFPRFRIYRLSRERPTVALYTSRQELAEGFPRYAFCIHSHVPAIAEDELLSMKLLLDHDEARFLWIAHPTFVVT